MHEPPKEFYFYIHNHVYIYSCYSVRIAVTGISDKIEQWHDNFFVMMVVVVVGGWGRGGGV